MYKNANFGNLLFTLALYVFLTVLGVMTLYPFINILAISFNDSLDSLKGGIYLVPRIFTFENYLTIIQNDQLFGATLRSIIRTVVGTGLGILCSLLFAYALSRKEFRLRKPLNIFLVLTLYVNGGLIPMYILIKNMHLTNNFLVFILPLLVNAYYVIIMRSYIDQLPEALVESAKIDGADHFTVLFRVILPISLPSVATITLFLAVMHWNSWFDNYLYASRADHLSLLQYELQKILQSTSQQQSATSRIDASSAKMISPESIRAAMTIIATLPILFVYPFLQRYFIQGMTIGAVKE